MAAKIEKLPLPDMILGEGPHWDSDRQTLYFVDIIDKSLHRYVPATKEYAKAKVGSPLATGTTNFIIPIAGSSDLFAVSSGHKVHLMRWDGQDGSGVEVLQDLAEMDQSIPQNCLNDGKVDPRGRLFTGTIGLKSPSEMEKEGTEGIHYVPTGSFYSLTTDGEIKKHDTGIMCSNGIAFDVSRKALYHVDTMALVIRRFDYDVDTGTLSNKSVLFNFKEAQITGSPDGMTIDTDGNLWVANFGGGNVLNINPDTKQVIRTITIPAEQVTSATFGGPNLDVLYVTTAKFRKPSGGATYAVTGLGVRGFENIKKP